MSKDNFAKRPKKEINFLIKLIHAEIQEFANDPLIEKRKVNVKFYGAYEQYLDKKTIKDLRQVEQRTANYTNCYVSILLVYNGKDELIEGLKNIKNTKHITDSQIKNSLWTKSLPNVDLIVRTGVECDPHLSGNVLLWQTDYSQLYFTKTLYPEFSTQELGVAIADYKTRMRRHGK